MSEALGAILRKPGADEEIIYKEEAGGDELGSTSHSRRSSFKKKLEASGEMKPVKAILPKYEIDSSSTEGLIPKNISGAISFHDVEFSYPTRSTVAFVGPSGGGKSTVVALVRFMLYTVVFLHFHVSSFPLILIVLFQGTHDHLMAEQRYYHGLVDKQEGRP